MGENIEKFSDLSVLGTSDITCKQNGYSFQVELIFLSDAVPIR